MKSRVVLLVLVVPLVATACSGEVDERADRESTARASLASPSSQGSEQPTEPSLTIDGPAQLESPARVTITGQGFEPDAYVVLAQCAADELRGQRMQSGCDLKHPSEIRADSLGNVRGDIFLTPVLQYGVRLERNCLIESCALVAGESESEMAIVEMPLEWAQGTELPQRPTLRIVDIEPAGGDPNAALAMLRGEGFPPEAVVDLAQCPRVEQAGVEAGVCLFSYAANIKANVSGEFTVPMRVFRLFQRPDGELIDCVNSNHCVIANVWPEQQGSWMANTRLRIPAS